MGFAVKVTYVQELPEIKEIEQASQVAEELAKHMDSQNQISDYNIVLLTDDEKYRDQEIKGVEL